MVESPKSIADKKKKDAGKKKVKQTSSQKRTKQSNRNRLRNRGALTALKTILKRFHALTTRKEAEAALPGVYSALAKARKKGALHARTASRYKSRLALGAKKLT